ncbi:unnamed protein product [Echinostoma caproni]|uniref:Heat shock protein 70 n=1 Tax=Echinostoma caproni TaxID=27848 RepID=A0A183AIM6_9TREM|nr:unnamed protein product [Echinostoma caproni]
MENDIAIGIDLGTTYSCVAAIVDSEAVVIGNDVDERTTRSVVHFSTHGTIVGAFADAQYLLDTGTTIYNSKRLLGRRFCEVNNALKWGFAIVDCDGEVGIETTVNPRMSPVQVAEELLKYLRQCAQNYLQQDVTRAVITVPARFNHVQRQATMDAAKNAGFKEVMLLNEPTAVALAFQYDVTDDNGQNYVVVYDFGGGTFDVSVLQITGQTFRALATHGDAQLGGTDIDELLVNYCVDTWKESYPDLQLKKDEFQNLLHLCELAKKELTYIDCKCIELQVDNLTEPLVITLDQFQLLRIVEPLIQRTVALTNDAVREAGLSNSQIDHVIVVGGSSRIPRVRNLLSEHFDANRLTCEWYEDEAVAIGAARLAHHWNQRNDIIDFVIQEYVTSSLGLCYKNEKMYVMIPKGSQLPQEKVLKITTVKDNQTKVVFWVFEGDTTELRKNTCLGHLVMTNLKPAPAGALKLVIRFVLNPNSMLIVSAYDEQTGEKQEAAFRCRSEFPSRREDNMVDVTGNDDTFEVS